LAVKGKMPARKVIDWDAIRTEWDLGQLDVREIARQHGIDHSSIVKRAQRKGWPARPEKSEVVTDLATKMTREASVVTNNPRFALTAFSRVISLLLRHRKMLGRLDSEIERCLDDVARIRFVSESGGLLLQLGEVDTIMTIVAKASQALARLAPLERRAFGLTDTDGPSEFDALSNEQLEAVDATVRRALGVPDGR
jgi:hypothetical protein